MIGSLIEAGAYCEQPSNRPELIRMLAQARYLDVDESLLQNSLIGPFDTGRGRRAIDDFIVFHRKGANIPDRLKGRRTFKAMRRMRVAESCKALRPDVIGRIFREDLFHEARRRLALRDWHSGNPPEETPQVLTSGEPDEPATIVNPLLALAG